ncbi:MAG TPA: alpha/beta hydrolase [Woeseiaceae bacterium]|nr:alpha/beta hydrolase [Woeseiaceae bacterium]
MPKPRPEEIKITGPAGGLEAIHELPAGTAPRGAAVVLHPHPQYGGTMNNKVVHTLARSFIASDFAALRFNFRGTEGSAGTYDEGIGEVDDALAAIGWLRAQYPNLPLWVAGFSFGAAMAIRAAVQAEPDGLIAVAPAVSRFAAGLDRQPRCPWLVIQGDQDELVDIDDTIAWFDTLDPGPELLVLPGVSHFFHGRLIELREAALEFVTANS